MAARSNRRRPLCLTDIPDDVILKILCCLDIRDAVRTSALSRAWRHRWRHLPELDFRRCSFGRLGLVSAAQSVLLRHLAQVKEFALDGRSPPLPVADHPRLDDLLIHLSPPHHALEVLLLDLRSYKLHSSSSFAKLNYLDLIGCLLPNFPPGFTGLCNLKGLYVHYTVELEPHLNSAQFDMLAALTSGCPGLERLLVKVTPEVPGGVTLKIAAPHLHHLEIKARSTGLVVEFVSLLPDLAYAKLRLPFSRYAREGGSKIRHILQGIAQVQTLKLLDGSPLVDFQDVVPINIQTKFENLQYLTIDADLGDAAHIVLVLDFLRYCPNIKDLRIKLPVSRYGLHHLLEETQEFWNTHGSGDLFQCLRIMKLINVYLSYNELQFIKLVLSKAHVLEKFTIVYHAENESSRLKACIEIMKFKRASQEAQIEYKVASEH